MIEELKKNKKLIIFGIMLIVLVYFSLYFLNNNEFFYKELNHSYQELETYSANKYIPIYINEGDMAHKYLNDYKNLILINREKAYELLNENYRNKKFGNYENFNDYVNTKFVFINNINIDKYSVSNSNNGRFFIIYDKKGNKYIIKEKSIMNYEVFLDDYTVEVK